MIRVIVKNIIRPEGAYKNGRWQSEEARRLMKAEIPEYASDLLIHADEDVIIKGPKGKPYLKYHPEIFYNISHSEERLMLVISDKEVGCDIERIGKAELKIADRFFTKDEAEYIRGLSDDEARKAFFSVWTLKESLIKACGRGLSMPLNEFAVIDSFGQPLKDIETEDGKYSFFVPYRDDGYACAYCVKN